jgi:hypothetical protein
MMTSTRFLLMRIGWPAFLAACVLELMVFAMVDPQELHWGGQALELSRQAAYTAAFFIFWLVSVGACSVTVLLGWEKGANTRFAGGEPGVTQGIEAETRARIRRSEAQARSGSRDEESCRN